MAPALSRSVELFGTKSSVWYDGPIGNKNIATELPTNPPSVRLLWSCGCNGDIPWSGRAEGLNPLRADGAKE